MNGRKFYLIMVGVVVLLGAGIFVSAYFGSALLNKQAARLTNVKLESKVAEEQQNALNLAKVYIEKYSELAQEARAIVPQDKNQAQAVREIIKIAALNNVNIENITFPSSTLGQSSATVTPGGVSGGAATSIQTKTPVTQVLPVSGIPGVYAMEINVLSGSGHNNSQLVNFLADLEKNRRTAQVTSVTIKPEKVNADSLTFTLKINVYIKP